MKGSPGRSRFSHRNDGCGGPRLKQAVPEGLNLMEKTHAGAVHEGLSAMGGPHTGAREQYGREGMVKRSCYGLSKAAMTLCATQGEETEV